MNQNAFINTRIKWYPYRTIANVSETNLSKFNGFKVQYFGGCTSNVHPPKYPRTNPKFITNIYNNKKKEKKDKIIADAVQTDRPHFQPQSAFSSRARGHTGSLARRTAAARRPIRSRDTAIAPGERKRNGPGSAEEERTPRDTEREREGKRRTFDFSRHACGARISARRRRGRKWAEPPEIDSSRSSACARTALFDVGWRRGANTFFWVLMIDGESVDCSVHPRDGLHADVVWLGWGLGDRAILAFIVHGNVTWRMVFCRIVGLDTFLGKKVFEELLRRTCWSNFFPVLPRSCREMIEFASFGWTDTFPLLRERWSII